MQDDSGRQSRNLRVSCNLEPRCIRHLYLSIWAFYLLRQLQGKCLLSPNASYLELCVYVWKPYVWAVLTRMAWLVAAIQPTVYASTFEVATIHFIIVQVLGMCLQIGTETTMYNVQVQVISASRAQTKPRCGHCVKTASSLVPHPKFFGVACRSLLMYQTLTLLKHRGK